MFKEFLKISDIASRFIEKMRKPKDDCIEFEGRYKVEIWRKGKLHQTLEGKNTIVNEGKNKLLNVMFNSASQLTYQFIGLLAGTGTISSADTLASHAGWTEDVNYDEATRGAWTTSSSTAQSVTNGTAQAFTMNATTTVKGIFIAMHTTSAAGTKSGTTGTLWAAALFGTAASLDSGDILRVYYTVNC